MAEWKRQNSRPILYLAPFYFRVKFPIQSGRESIILFCVLLKMGQQWGKEKKNEFGQLLLPDDVHGSCKARRI